MPVASAEKRERASFAKKRGATSTLLSPAEKNSAVGGAASLLCPRLCTFVPRRVRRRRHRLDPKPGGRRIQPRASPQKKKKECASVQKCQLVMWPAGRMRATRLADFTLRRPRPAVRSPRRCPDLLRADNKEFGPRHSFFPPSPVARGVVRFS